MTVYETEPFSSEAAAWASVDYTRETRWKRAIKYGDWIEYVTSPYSRDGGHTWVFAVGYKSGVPKTSMLGPPPLKPEPRFVNPEPTHTPEGGFSAWPESVPYPKIPSKWTYPNYLGRKFSGGWPVNRPLPSDWASRVDRGALPTLSKYYRKKPR